MTRKVDWTKIHDKSTEALEDELNIIRTVIIHHDPKYLIPELTLFCYLFLNKRVVEPGYLEYLYGLIISEGRQKEYKGRFSWAAIEGVMLSLESFFENWMYSNLSRKVKDLKDQREKEKQFLAASLSTDYVLNGGETNYELLKSQVMNVFQSSRKWMKKNEGFTITQVFHIIEAITGLYEQRLSAFKEDIVIASQDLMDRQYRLMAGKASASEEERESQRLYKENRKELLARYVSNRYEQVKKDILLITEEDLMGYEPNLDKKALHHFIQRFSSSIDKPHPDFKYPTDDNPFRERPIVSFGDTFIVPSILSLVWAVQKEIESDILMDEEYRETYTEKKGRSLEDEVNQVFKKILPGCQVYSPVHYYIEENGEKKRCELDHLIMYDSNLFLVESKSGRFTKTARRGAFLSFQSSIADNIEKAFVQARRARKYINDNERPIFKNKSGKKILTLDNKEKYFNLFLLNITLDNFGQAATNLHKLRDIGVYRYKEYPWSVHLNDLKKIAEFIEFPSQFLHYVHRRLKVSNRLDIKSVIRSSRELDLFYNYLVQNLYFDDITSNDLIILESGGETLLNHYLSRQGHKEKPRQAISAGMKAIIRRLEQSRQFGHSYIIMQLLELNANARKHMERTIDAVLDTSRKNKGKITEAVMKMEEADLGVSIIACEAPSLNHENWLARCYMRMYEHQTSSWLGLINYTDKATGEKVDAVLMIARKEPLKQDPQLDELLDKIGRTV
ncbi:NERD domain-containing protein [Bacillus thermotolerans]|uniref:NERD domain-containing protein n=1 Tax=Bacillus thermotolerans TaxID=1221996 RepID=A0A0F5HM78_BACTR|nr:NERD domain-containing protein [Bacillus thermotolerans]KKB34494.1 hypothetical protein QY95_03845 [Bacillus thermotolerans]